MKAQASIEQLVVFATAIAFVSIAFYLAANYSTDSVRISQAQNAVGRLAAAADRVYSLGPGSKEYVTVSMPDDIRNANVSARRILLTIGTSSGTSDIFATSKPELVGSVPSRGGKQKIMVEYLPSGKVKIGDAGLSCSPSLIARSFRSGDNGSDSLDLFNNAEVEVTGITENLTGSTLLISSSSPPESLAAGAGEAMTLSYIIPADQESGAYGATVAFDSENGGACSAQVTLFVSGNSTCPTMCGTLGYSSGSCRSAPANCSYNGEDYREENDAGCSGMSGKPACCCWPSNDVQGPLVTYVSTPPNASISDNVTLNATCNDTGRGNNYIASAEVQVDFGAWEAADPATGGFFTSVIQDVEKNIGQLVTGQHIAAVRCTDSANNTGPVVYYFFNIGGIDLLGPIVINIGHSDPFPTTLANITENATASETYTGNNNVTGCWMKVDTGDWMNATPADGAFDGNVEEFSYFVGRLKSGQHTVYARCQDRLGNMGGIFNDTFGVKDADIALVIDRSGSMAWMINNSSIVSFSDNDIVAMSDPVYTSVKNISVSSNISLGNLTVELKTNGSYCGVDYVAKAGGTTIASGSSTGGWQNFTTNGINISTFGNPFTLSLELRNSQGSEPSYENAGTFANDNSAGTVAWTNPGNAQTSNNGYATAALSSGQATQYLKATNFGFAIPAGATIDGIQVRVERKASNTNAIKDYRVRLVKNGAVGTADKATGSYWPNSDASVTYGGASDLWGESWSAEDLNNASTGIVFSAQSSVNSRTASVDYINMTAYYTLPSGLCGVSNRGFRLAQVTASQSKMQAVQNAANIFVDISANTTQIALASFASSSTLNKQLMGIGSSANKTTIKNAINALVASGSTCLECGLDTAVNELISSRGRYPSTVRVMIFMTDGEETMGSDPIAGAVYARNNNVKIYTIGFGSDSDTTVLTNIALLTEGKYYYAPDYDTLMYIYQHIGE